MKRTLLLALAIAVIPVGVDAQVTPSVACADLSYPSAVSLEDTLTCAEQGYALAQWMMGQRYTGHVGDEQFGDHLSIYGVLEDRAESARWYRLSAEQGFWRAQNSLGMQYFLGWGVPEDYVLAYMWMNLAQAQDDEMAELDWKAIVEEQMTREQIAEAQRMSREWLEAHPSGN